MLFCQSFSGLLMVITPAFPHLVAAIMDIRHAIPVVQSMFEVMPG